jgi:hypothetical protein
LLILCVGYYFGSGKLSKKNIQYFWKRLFIFNFIFIFILLEGKGYVVPYGTVVTGILDMCPGKHDLHFLVGVELLPHAFMNIPDEKVHIRVFFIFIFIIHFIFIYANIF